MIRFFLFILLFFIALLGPVFYTKKFPSKKGFRNRVFFLAVFLGLLFIATAPSKSAGEETPMKTATRTTTDTTIATVSADINSSEEQKLMIDWQKPSEDKPYPELKETDWIDVSLADQRVYFKRGDDILYTMYCSTGAPGESETPKGTYEIQPEKGLNFYNASSGEGANYYVSFLNHGEYLFHTVPVDTEGNYIEAEAKKLGLEAASHGCVRLSVPDAKWLYEHAITGMKVVIA